MAGTTTPDSWITKLHPAYWWAQFKHSVMTVDEVSRPILSQQEIHALGDEVARFYRKPFPNPKASDAKKQGEQASRYLGSGMEYEESRAYQPGDEVRRINWRLMARTGQPFTKRFQEERQENWTLLVDQRQSMRFGTQTRLKVTQAARVAGYFAWQAQRQAVPLDAIRLSEHSQPSPVFEGQGTFDRLMAFVSMPCPPLQNVQESRLYDELMACQAQLQSGSRLMIISDFMDLDEACLQVLAALREKVMVMAVMIVDPVEKRLPNLSGVQLQSLNGDFKIEHLSVQQQKNYQAWSQGYFTKKLDGLAQVGVKTKLLSSEQDLSALADLDLRGASYG